MSYSWSLERWLKLLDLSLRYTEWATLAQDRAEWARLITHIRPHHHPSRIINLCV